MKKVFRNLIVLTAFLFMALMVKAAVIGAPSTSSTVGTLSVNGCGGGGTDQQAKGFKVACTKLDGSSGTQCVTTGTGDVCDLKVIECQ